MAFEASRRAAGTLMPCLAAVDRLDADRVPVPGGHFGTEPARDFLLGFGQAQVTFGVVRGGRDPQVIDKAQHVARPK